MMSKRNSTVYDLVLDVHGMHAAEALSQIDKEVCRTPNARILIIHGHGSGKLKNEIRSTFKEHELVEKVLFGEDHNLEGRDGVSLVITVDFPYS